MAILIIVKFADDVNLKKTVLESSGSCSVPTLILFRKQLKWDKSIYEYFNKKHINKPIKHELLTFENMFNFHYIKQDNQKHFQRRSKTFISVELLSISRNPFYDITIIITYSCGLTELQT